MTPGADLFVYGSLMFEPVWRSVVRGQYPSQPARLDGHRRLAIRGEHYPGLLAAPGWQVEGLLYRWLDASDLDRLDAFEGADYRRIEVQVRPLLPAAAALPAYTYLYLLPERCTGQEWQPERFAPAIDDFLRQYRPRA